jgi:hypothetical protein
MMLRFCLAILLSVGLGLVACRSSSLYENDELLWTKKLWPEFKLDFPYATFQNDDAEQLQAQQDLAEFDHHSLAGPYSKQELQQRVQENLRKQVGCRHAVILYRRMHNKINHNVCISQFLRRMLCKRTPRTNFLSNQNPYPPPTVIAPLIHMFLCLYDFLTTLPLHLQNSYPTEQFRHRPAPRIRTH